MAALLDINSAIERLKSEYFNQNRLAEEHKQRNVTAALKIQSWFKGCTVRADLRFLHKSATAIQTMWRGFAARVRYKQMKKEADINKKIELDNQRAVMIQRRWKGFYVRKNVLNFYARKKFLDEVATINSQFRTSMDELQALQTKEREHLQKEKEKRHKLLQAQKLHYLLSTEQRPGVFNSPFRPTPHEMELLMRQVKPQPTVRTPPREDASLGGMSGPAAPSLLGASGSSWSKRSHTCCNTVPILPPIDVKKPQGPFRESYEVWRQRMRNLEPSIRVQTPYTHLEEARKTLWLQWDAGHISDKPFLPFARNHHKGKKYERQLHGTSAFAPIAYGSKHFRESAERPHKEMKPFRTVFTSCSVFDKFGRLYSRSGDVV